MKEKKKKLSPAILAVVCGVVLAPMAWLAVTRFEGEAPRIEWVISTHAVGVSQSFPIRVADEKSGVRRVWLGIVKDGKEKVLFEKEVADSVLQGSGKQKAFSFTLKLEPAKQNITDGKATLRLVVWDCSWRDWGKGNRAHMEKEVIIDTRAPKVDVLSKAHYITQGGTGLAVYRLSEPCPESGVFVGKIFYPGYGGYFKDRDIHLCFFAVGYDQDRGTRIRVTATDYAGNRSQGTFYYHIRRGVFKNDTITVSDGFLKRKIPEFKIKSQPGGGTSQLDTFLAINNDLRSSNFKKITEACKKRGKTIFWQGTFLRLPKSAPKAGFADHRHYTYKGRTVDKQVHLGVDLASHEHAPVPAANRGKIIFAGAVGIYGKTLLVDHGFGLISMYAHLSRFDVQEGDIVSKGQTIGRTGDTGLAGGDHLHFSMLVHQTFVNPKEWWDGAWIKNNITAKMDAWRADR